ncbi:MAG: PQQ-binding-like beta-propeller repeat protein [Endomicrobiales bacterium]|nr:PQQ-binding-like beta-propeller repeat protein [Endomicrobiales bacterium]
MNERFIKTAVKNIIACTAVFLLSATHIHSASSPLFRVNATRTGQIVEEASPKLTPLWNFQLQGEFISSPVVYQGVVYCGGRDGSLHAWDAATGELLWDYSTDGWIDATPCVTSDAVYIPSRDGYFYAFNRLTGDILWRTHTGSTDCSSPVLYSGKLYFLSGSPVRKLYRIDAATGVLETAANVSQFGFSSPAVKDNLMFFGTNDGQFHCFDLSAGTILWSRPTSGGINYATFAVSDDYVYAVSGGDERRLFCLNPLNGNIVWRSAEFDNDSASVSSVAVGDDGVFVATSYRTDLGGGNYSTDIILMSFPLVSASMDTVSVSSVTIGTPHPSGVVSSPSLANHVLYIGSGDGRLYCLSTSGGTLQFIEPATGSLTSSPTGYFLCDSSNPSYGIVATCAVSNGKLFVGTYDGYLWAFDAYKKLYLSSPDVYDSQTDSILIKGAVSGFSQPGYKIEYGPGGNPSSWTEVITSAQDPSSEDLASWDIAGYPDGTYSLRLTPLDGSSARAVNVFSMNNSPAAPATLAAADTPFDAGGSITLSWTLSTDDGAGSNDVRGYNIYKSTWSGGYSLLAQVANGVNTYADSDCPAETTFYFILRARDDINESLNSNSACAFSMVDGVIITPEEGGTVTLEKDGLVTEVVIEPGSVTSPVRVGIRIPTSYSNTGIPQSAEATTVVREFGVTPAGTVFLKPAIIKIPYRENELPDIIRENLRIYWWDESRNSWRIVNTSDPNTENSRVWARIPHFSLYRVMQYVPGKEELLTSDSVYSYPNPAKGDIVYFKYYLGAKADVKIDVYNVAGELITHIEKTECPAGIVSEAEWDISSIASGVYIFVVNARSDSRDVTIKKKTAIIH